MEVAEIAVETSHINQKGTQEYMDLDPDGVIYVWVWVQNINLDKEKVINVEGLSHDKRLID